MKDMASKGRRSKRHLTPDEVRYIRQKFKTMDGTATEKYRILAEEFSHTSCTIKNIIKRKSFANVHDVPRPVLNRVEEQLVEYRM